MRLSHLPVLVDHFRPEAGVKIYLLSHFHTDHLVGLSPSWNHGIIFCSAVTRALVLERFAINPHLVIALDLDVPHLLPLAPKSSTDLPRSAQYFQQTQNGHRLNQQQEFPSAAAGGGGASSANVGSCHSADDPRMYLKVTLFDANHIPGSVMFYCEAAAGLGNYLYTGDFRFNPQRFQKLFSKVKVHDSTNADSTTIADEYDETVAGHHRPVFPPHHPLAVGANGGAVLNGIRYKCKLPVDHLFLDDTWLHLQDATHFLTHQQLFEAFDGITAVCKTCVVRRPIQCVPLPPPPPDPSVLPMSPPLMSSSSSTENHCQQPQTLPQPPSSIPPAPPASVPSGESRHEQLHLEEPTAGSDFVIRCYLHNHFGKENLVQVLALKLNRALKLDSQRRRKKKKEKREKEEEEKADDNNTSNAAPAVVEEEEEEEEDVMILVDDRRFQCLRTIFQAQPDPIDTTTNSGADEGGGDDSIDSERIQLHLFAPKSRYGEKVSWGGGDTGAGGSAVTVSVPPPRRRIEIVSSRSDVAPNYLEQLQHQTGIPHFGILMSGWAGVQSKKEQSDVSTVMTWKLPYSLHCTPTEVQTFVAAISPKSIRSIHRGENARSAVLMRKLGFYLQQPCFNDLAISPQVLASALPPELVKHIYDSNLSTNHPAGGGGGGGGGEYYSRRRDRDECDDAGGGGCEVSTTAATTQREGGEGGPSVRRKFRWGGGAKIGTDDDDVKKSSSSPTTTTPTPPATTTGVNCALTSLLDECMMMSGAVPDDEDDEDATGCCTTSTTTTSSKEDGAPDVKNDVVCQVEEVPTQSNLLTALSDLTSMPEEVTTVVTTVHRDDGGGLTTTSMMSESQASFLNTVLGRMTKKKPTAATDAAESF